MATIFSFQFILPKNFYSTPFVLGNESLLMSFFTAILIALAKALKIDSIL
jgi:hypothetical protein